MQRCEQCINSQLPELMSLYVNDESLGKHLNSTPALFKVFNDKFWGPKLNIYKISFLYLAAIRKRGQLDKPIQGFPV